VDTAAREQWVFSRRGDARLEAHLQSDLNVFGDFPEIFSKWYRATFLIADNYPHAAAGAALTGNELLLPPPKATKATAEAAEATTAPLPPHSGHADARLAERRGVRHLVARAMEKLALDFSVSRAF